MKSIIVLVLIFPFTNIQSQNMSDMPVTPVTDYSEIPEYPDEYTAHTTVARMLDGLGYRYYWATEGLTDKDLEYAPSADGRTIRETMDHIYSLVKAALLTIKGEPVTRNQDYLEMDDDALRNWTLQYIGEASIALKDRQITAMEDMDIRFKRGELESVFPFWNMINGPITDAIYHVGQVVTYRRSAGNPLDPSVNVFTGKNR